MPGKPVPGPVVAELQRQLNHELGAAHAYTALAIWCVDQNLKGFASYFYKQAEEEREHAQRMVNHLLDRGVLPKLQVLDAPKSEFGDLLDVARTAQAMEQANTLGIHACYEAALKTGDYPAQVLLQWFINEQVEEEAWTDEMVERVVRANCAGGVAELDRHIERHLENTPGEAGE